MFVLYFHLATICVARPVKKNNKIIMSVSRQDTWYTLKVLDSRIVKLERITGLTLV
jgi:hypothetical protein